jgi:hypothetical protein
MSKCSCGNEAYYNDICDSCREDWERQIEQEKYAQWLSYLEYLKENGECVGLWEQIVVSCGYGCGKEYDSILVCSACGMKVFPNEEKCRSCNRKIVGISE